MQHYIKHMPYKRLRQFQQTDLKKINWRKKKEKKRSNWSNVNRKESASVRMFCSKIDQNLSSVCKKSLTWLKNLIKLFQLQMPEHLSRGWHTIIGFNIFKERSLPLGHMQDCISTHAWAKVAEKETFASTATKKRKKKKIQLQLSGLPAIYIFFLGKLDPSVKLWYRKQPLPEKRLSALKRQSIGTVLLSSSKAS